MTGAKRYSRTTRFGRLGVTLGVAVGAIGIAGGFGGPALADHQTGHDEPQGSAKIRFAEDFPELLDEEWGFPIGGFGGIAAGAARVHAPVILVHGNNVDHADWYPVRDDFLAAGWTDQEVWALSYNGLGGNNGTAIERDNPERDAEHTEMGWDGTTRVTANDVNVPDLAAFIRAVQTYTGSEHYHLVSHSLGVTLARKTLQVHPELQSGLVSFVGIAGANDGTTFCPPGSEGQVHSCDEIAAGTAWLDELNGPNGELETYGATKWLTIYDGTGGGDPAYVGPTYAQSPALEGAENVEYPGVYHNDLRIRADIVAFYRAFIEQAEVDAGLVAAPSGQVVSGGEQQTFVTGPATQTAAQSEPTLPEAGIGTFLLALSGLLSIAGGETLRRRSRPRSDP